MTSIRTREGEGSVRCIEELEIRLTNDGLPMMWIVHEEEVANNFGGSNEDTDAMEKESKEFFILIHTEGVLEVLPVMAKEGMEGKLDIEATLGRKKLQLGKMRA